MKRVVIIGFGRFGELLASILRNDFVVAICDSDQGRQATAQTAGFETVTHQEIGRFDIVIFAVPISLLEQAVAAAAPHIQDSQLVMDICSVKVHPARVMREHLSNCQIIATHPMFGPDSASKGLAGLQVAICPITATDENTQVIVSFWQKQGVETILTTPENHDRDAAYSQAFTYSIAKIILGMDLSGVKLTTRSFNAIAEVAKLSANDSEQLFHDMLYYNPYFQDMKQQLLVSMERATERLNEIETEQNESKIFTSRSHKES